MKIQNLSSIVNDPKSDSFVRYIYQILKMFRQVQRKLWTGNPLEYKPMKESQVPESYTLPKIAQKDFNDYLQRVRQAYSCYVENHK